VFDGYDADGSESIDRGELKALLNDLGALTVSDAFIDEMFSYAHRDDLTALGKSLPLTFKEFLNFLAIGSVLGQFPFLTRETGTIARSRSSSALADGGRPLTPPTGLDQQQPTVGGTWAKERGSAMIKALRLVVEAYCIFDNDGSGTIDKDEVFSMLDEENRRARAARAEAPSSRHSEAGAGSTFLSRERWEELDWDHDGKITFKEFLAAMLLWVGVDEEEDEEEADVASSRDTRTVHSARSLASSTGNPQELKIVRLDPASIAAGADGAWEAEARAVASMPSPAAMSGGSTLFALSPTSGGILKKSPHTHVASSERTLHYSPEGNPSMKVPPSGGSTS
jgi:Ca2+-binding EF-hand superfamily protein